MYKVEEFFASNLEELEHDINIKCTVENMQLVSCSETSREDYYIVVFSYSNTAKQMQLKIDEARKNLCKECLTCAKFAYLCRGRKEGCEEWELDENAARRIDKIV